MNKNRNNLVAVFQRNGFNVGESRRFYALLFGNKVFNRFGRHLLATDDTLVRDAEQHNAAQTIQHAANGFGGF